jgi:hypothetical protein
MYSKYLADGAQEVHGIHHAVREGRRRRVDAHGVAVDGFGHQRRVEGKSGGVHRQFHLLNGGDSVYANEKEERR